MVAAKEVEKINLSLIDFYGINTFSSQPIFRIVWSNDQFEKRLMHHTDAGIELLYPEVREVPKYRNWCPNRYILERLVVVPGEQVKELAGLQVSYEPLYTFEDGRGLYLPPKLEATKFIIDTVLSTQAVSKAFITGNESIERRTVRYSDPENTQEAAMHMKKARIDNIIEELGGDESSLMGTTIDCGSAIIVPQNYERSKS
jgi:hypothetical protein